MLSFGLILYLLVIVEIVSPEKLPIPSYFKPCHTMDPNFDKCCMENARDALPFMVKGDKKYGIPSLTPLELQTISIASGQGLSVSLNDIKLYGLDKAVLKNIKINDATGEVVVDLHFDELNIISKYTLEGKILVLPLEGHGNSNITVVGCEVQYRLTYVLKERDGDKYIQVDRDNAEFDVKRAYFNFENLFNGNKQLGDNTNKFLNEQHKPVIEEVKPSILKIICNIAESVITSVTSKVPHHLVLPK